MLPFSHSIPHSSFPFFIHEINFTFFPSIAPTPNSYQCFSFYPLKIISFSVGHLISTLFSYNSLNLVTPLLVLLHLMLIVGLLGGVTFEGKSFFPELCSFVMEASAQQHTRRGKSDPQSTSWRKGPTKEGPNNQYPFTSREPT